MATRKKSPSKRRRPIARRKHAARKAKKRSARGKVRALVAGRLPAPIYGVPRDKVGTTVQRFIDWDGVREMSVLEEALGTFQVTPLA